MKKPFHLLLFSLSSTFVGAQNFKYKALIQTIQKDGFYKIELSPLVLAKSSHDLEDLRIKANDGKEIPYIKNSEVAYFIENNFIPFKIDNTKSDGNKQVLIIENPNLNTINNFIIEMKNAFGEKKTSISGSSDGKEWFMIHQGFTFTVPGNESSPLIYKAIDFPMSDYKWFSITFMDTVALSLNILRIGNYTKNTIIGKYGFVNIKNKVQKDSSDKKTYISLDLSEPNYVSRINIQVSEPDHYQRNATLILTPNDLNIEKKLTSFSSRPYNNESQKMDITLSSELEHLYDLNVDFKIKSIELIIENKDNSPLTIKNLELQQLKTYLSAKLETGKSYDLFFGDSTLTVPEYDLKYFEDKIPNDAPVITHLPIEPNGVKNSKAYKNNNKIYIWITIGLAGLVLAFVSNKMLQEVRRKSVN